MLLQPLGLHVSLAQLYVLPPVFALRDGKVGYELHWTWMSFLPPTALTLHTAVDGKHTFLVLSPQMFSARLLFVPLFFEKVTQLGGQHLFSVLSSQGLFVLMVLLVAVQRSR